MKYMMRNGILPVIMITGLLIPSLVGAAMFTSRELVAPADPVDDDLYAAGADISINHDVRDDTFLAGNTVTIQAPVGADVYAVGREVEITSEIGDDIMAAGNFVILEGASAEDVFAAGERVSVDQPTTIRGDLYAAGARITINGTINGTVRVSGDQVSVGPNARIGGDLIVYGPEPASVDDGAQINGERQHIVAAVEEPSMRQQVLGWVRSVLTWFAVTLVLLYLLPLFARSVVQTTVEQSALAVGVGALWLLVAIPAAVLLLVTVILWPLGLLVLILLVGTLLVALPYAALAVGAWLSQRLQRDTAERLSWQTALLGVVALKLIALIPVIGGLIVLAAMVVSSGAVLRVLWRRLRSGAAAPPQVPEVAS